IPEPAQQWRERPGRERRPVGQNAALRCGQREAPALPAGLVADRSNGGVLVDPYPGGQAGLPEPPGEPGRVDGRATIAIPEPAKVRWRVHLRSYLARVEQLRAEPQPASHLRRLGQAVKLPRLSGHRKIASPGEVALDAVTRDCLLDLVQVLPAEALKGVRLIGKAVKAVAEPVGDARGAEAAVPASSRPGDPAPFNE